jgi:hypothetical protein
MLGLLTTGDRAPAQGTIDLAAGCLDALRPRPNG